MISADLYSPEEMVAQLHQVVMLLILAVLLLPLVENCQLKVLMLDWSRHTLSVHNSPMHRMLQHEFQQMAC